MPTTRCRVALPAAVALLTIASAALADPGKVRGALPLAFRARPAADGTRRVIGPAKLAPVTIRLAASPGAADVSALEGLGAVIGRRDDGSLRQRGRIVFAEVPADALDEIAGLPWVERIALDGAPFEAPPPLDFTAGLIEAPATWATPAADGLPTTGRGVTVCDIDSGIDAFHPLFFRADGGYHAWVDVDGDGVFEPGKDGIDLHGDGTVTVLRVLDSVLEDRKGKVIYDSDDPGLAVGWDWLYADLDGSGAREFGPKAGFTEADPTYGEPLFVVDDVDGDGVLGPGEKIVALGTSKIAMVRAAGKTFTRGQNLIDFPIGDDASHGTGATSILVGGNRGLTRFVGIAPDADLIVGVRDQQGLGTPAFLTDFCIDHGARVVLHEYAPWVGYHLDGSDDVEEMIDGTVGQGVAHVNPAGNLSTSDKICKRALPAGVETVIPIEAPPDFKLGGFHMIAGSLLWRDPSRALALTLEDPTGFSMPLAAASDDQPIYTDWHDGLEIYSLRDDSSRGTARVDFYIYGPSQTPPEIPLGTWKLHVVDPAPVGSPELEVIGAVMDDLSRWSKGIHFPESPNEEHLIGFPGTADHGIAVAAYTAHEFVYGGTMGERAYYSGRGHRIDGASILSISAPDDPITAGYVPGDAARYMLFGGTSGASPHVAGAAALLIAAKPEMTGDDVRAALRKGALVDEHVGAVPNDDYGYGKLRVYQSIYGKDPPGGQAPKIRIDPVEVHVGETTKVSLEISDHDEPASALRVDLDRDYDGTYDEEVSGATFEVNVETEGTLVAKVRVTDSTGKEATALAFVHAASAPEPPAVQPAPEEPRSSVAASGGGCGTRGGPIDAWWALAIASAAFASRRYPRHRRLTRHGRNAPRTPEENAKDAKFFFF